MDPALINQYLQSRGAEMSAGNAGRVREHFAANPDLMERRAMGLPGGLDDNSAVLDALLDKQIAESMPQAAAPVTNGDTNPAPAPSRRGPTTKQPLAKATYPEPNEAVGTPNNVRGAPSRMSGMVNEGGVPVEYTGEANVTPPQDSGILKWLLPILGLSAAVPAAENMRGQMSVAPPGALPPPQARITSQVGPNMESVGQEIDTVNNRNASARTGRENQIRAEVDAENDAMTRKMMEDESRARAQRRTKELTDAAKRATGRK